MTHVGFIPVGDFERVARSTLPKSERLRLLADMCRANALSCVKRAGSGHLGSSLSAMDLVVWLYYEEMNTVRLGVASPDRDVYFSSKGHDVPGLYAVLYALGLVSREHFLKLRRLGGLDGHPDVGVTGMEANSGSLGMGLSKARGMAWAKRRLGRGGRVFVMLGDGELQEGQNYEALQGAVHHRLGNLIAIVDHNKVQSDRRVTEVMDMGDLAVRLRAYGWQVMRFDGHNFDAIEDAFAWARTCATTGPVALVADTIKGCGVSFMEHPRALEEGKGYYRWHAGAPDDERFARAHAEVVARINAGLTAGGLPTIALEEFVPPGESAPAGALGEPPGRGATESRLKDAAEFVAEAYGKALLEAVTRRSDIVVLDADLAADCRVRDCERAHPERFIENGIAEQDMVSMAGGLARQGLLPVVNSFASFLASRANEQIYNNASERTRIVYACHYAGLIPAGPGKSHQSLRDISLFAALPNCTVVEPCNGKETALAVNWAVDEARENVALRLIIGPSPRRIALPAGYRWSIGRGATLHEGDDALLLAYGPVMLHEALLAAGILATRGRRVQVVNQPWLNRFDAAWLRETVGRHRHVFVVEDHAPAGGLYDHLLHACAAYDLLDGRRFGVCAVEGWPACGTPSEALRFHGLDGASIAARIQRALV